MNSEISTCFSETAVEKLEGVPLEEVLGAIEAANAWASFGLGQGLGLREVVGAVVMQASTSDLAVFTSMLLMQCYPIGVSQ